MQKSTIQLMVFFAVVILAAVAIIVIATSKPNTPKDDNTNTNITNPVITQPDSTPTTTPTDIEEPDTTPTTTPTTTPDTTPTTDLSGFKTSKQTIGALTDTEMTLDKVSNADKTDYHEFTFYVTPQNATSAPKVTAEYISYKSAIVVTIKNVSKNNTGIALQSTREIVTKGVERLYAAITSESKTVIYEIGVSKSTPFLLGYTPDTAGNINTFFLKVQYPGVVSKTVDLGSTTFSKDKQSITGATSADGAGIAGFSYNNVSGLFTLTMKVKGSETKPIPECYAEYTGGKLRLVFPSLKTTVFGYSKVFDSLGAVGSVTLTKTGNESVFTFDDVTNKDFKLSATTSPNQVLMQIKLK